MLTVMVTSGRLEDNLPRQKLTPILVNMLTSARKGMYIIQGID